MPLPLLPPYPWTPTTTFRGEEGHISFYKESEFDLISTRADLTPVGVYLFSNGISIEDSRAEHQLQQGYGQGTRNIRAPEYVETKVSVSALYTQEGLDLTWIEPGHEEYRIYVDFIDSSIGSGRSGDLLNANSQLVQTLIIQNAVCTSKKIRAVDDQIVTYSVDFLAGEILVMDETDMDTVVGVGPGGPGGGPPGGGGGDP